MTVIAESLIRPSATGQWQNPWIYGNRGNQSSFLSWLIFQPRYGLVAPTTGLCAPLIWTSQIITRPTKVTVVDSSPGIRAPPLLSFHSCARLALLKSACRLTGFFKSSTSRAFTYNILIAPSRKKENSYWIEKTGQAQGRWWVPLSILWTTEWRALYTLYRAGIGLRWARTSYSTPLGNLFISSSILLKGAAGFGCSSREGLAGALPFSSAVCFPDRNTAKLSLASASEDSPSTGA